ncbi:MAG: DNA primase [Candidatus Lumbricidophila eiseniae]|uniref:DNA primase n=1 Tax=Candidatus Lumbricidiphila eiseniae TaxID=1969409 RepID=A0A2A6FS95_9MICO|nr:MAG: DNA primase [Candidatus Lumbricidophila eiseniae]
MAGRIRQSDVDEVKARTNIADVVGDHVSLKSAGIGALKGLCPFHDERSPSFNVRPQAGYYHCFGCGESGDAYTFLQRLEHLSFAEAVERLAARLGYELHYEEGQSVPEQGNRARLLAANQAAAEFFVERLNAPEADSGRRFLSERGFDAAAAVRFGVGFAPKGWDALTKHLTGRGFTQDELEASGLVAKRDRGVYDRFRGRLVWPIRDVTGQTVGFGARKLYDDDQGPKYLNTPETPIYRKSQVLYGLDLARREIAKTHRVVVVEGYTDVMACHVAGVTVAIASCGTAFGGDHIKILRRVLGDDTGIGEVIFTFDGDDAGQQAVMKAFAQEQRFAAQTFVAIAPEGLDPCDLRLQRGDDAVRALIDTRTPMFEWVIKNTVARYRLESVEGRVAALRAAAPIVAGIRDSALRPGYSRVLAGMIGVELGEVVGAVRRAEAVTKKGMVASAEGAVAGAFVSGALVGAPGTSNGVVRDPGGQAEGGERVAQLSNDPSTRLERDALQAIIQFPQFIDPAQLQHALDCRIGNPTLAVVRDGIVTAWAAPLPGVSSSESTMSNQFGASPRTVEQIVAQVPQPYAHIVQQLAVAPLPQRTEAELAGYVRSVVAALIDRELLRQKAELVGRLQRTDPAKTEVFSAIQRALVDIETERRRLQGE